MFSYTKEALIDLGRHHWREHLPQTYRELEANGTLESVLAAAANMVLEEMECCQAAGCTCEEVWQMSQEILLEPEEPGRARNERMPGGAPHKA
jgi:hypothetical protein